MEQPHVRTIEEVEEELREYNIEAFLSLRLHHLRRPESKVIQIDIPLKQDPEDKRGH